MQFGDLSLDVLVFWTCNTLTPDLARLTLSREKCLDRPLSLLNFSSERVTAFLTSALFSLIKDGQSGQTAATLAAGTEQGEERGLGWKKKTVRRDLKEVTEIKTQTRFVRSYQ